MRLFIIIIIAFLSKDIHAQDIYFNDQINNENNSDLSEGVDGFSIIYLEENNLIAPSLNTKEAKANTFIVLSSSTNNTTIITDPYILRLISINRLSNYSVRTVINGIELIILANILLE